MEKWFIKNRHTADIEKISREFNIPSYISRILVNRGLTSKRSIDSFINPNLDRLHEPSLMKDLSLGVGLIDQDIKSNGRIRIVGDYDVDGVVSTYILYKGIERLGGRVDYDIPHRIGDGYGINKEIVRKAYEDGVDTIITCDNGIAAIEAVKEAKKMGMKIIVTDHHDLPFIEEDGIRKEVLVAADAVINPKRSDCDYPFKLLCGGGIAYKVIEELFKLNSKDGIYDFLEFASIATICDVVDLVDENRILASQGLSRLNNTKNLGLRALLEETKLIDKRINSYHIGFIIGPIINASGRLDSAKKALEIFISDDEEYVRSLAKELKDLNDDRKYMTEKGTETIIKKIESTDLINDSVLVVYEPSIHESIAGIIAGRIKDRYHRPTIVLTDGKDGVKGSARSIEEYNMFEELTKRKEFLSKFGGHPMAAGLSLDLEKLDGFRKSLNINDLTEEELTPKRYMEMGLGLDYISYELVYNLEKLGPFGKGNSKPVFGDKNIRLLDGRVLGENKNVLKLTLISESGKPIEGMIFNGVEEFEDLIIENYGEHELENLYNGLANNIVLDIIYSPSINEFRGNTKLQSIIESYRINS